MRFRYLADPLFIGCVILYFVNRFVIKRLVTGGFFHAYLNDLICIPFWVPIMLFFSRKAGLREYDGPPRADEILIPLILWSAWFKMFLPRIAYFSRLAVADYADVFFYTIGALAAWMLWEITYRDGRGAGRQSPDPSPPAGLRGFGKPDQQTEPTAPKHMGTGRRTCTSWSTGSPLIRIGVRLSGCTHSPATPSPAGASPRHPCGYSAVLS